MTFSSASSHFVRCMRRSFILLIRVLMLYCKICSVIYKCRLWIKFSSSFYFCKTVSSFIRIFIPINLLSGKYFINTHIICGLIAKMTSLCLFDFLAWIVQDSMVPFRDLIYYWDFYFYFMNIKDSVWIINNY